MQFLNFSDNLLQIAYIIFFNFFICYCNNFPGSVIPEGMSTMSNKYSMITFTINKTVTENWSTKVQKQRNSAATFIHFITEFTTS